MPLLRDAFPVCSTSAYLNTGTDGPVPGVARAAAAAALEAETIEGRVRDHFETRLAEQAVLREGYARVLGCRPADVALTTSTSEGLAKVLAGLGLGQGDEIVTSDQEHPGLIGPLLAARARGARIRVAPIGSLASAVDARTTLVAASHVGWLTGEEADAGLAGVDVPVVLDGAQGVGAVQFDVRALGCAAYAGSGQKWLCGADGTGMLYLEESFAQRVLPLGAAYTSFADTTAGLDSALHEDARRHDTAALAREGVAFSLAALQVLLDHGLDRVRRDGPELAGRLADELRERGRTVGPRGHTTLVAWEDRDPEATAGRLADQGVIVRHLPGTPYVRASVGAWNDESDIERLLAAL